MTRSRESLALVISLAICFAAAGIGSLLTMPSLPTWYAQLAKPAWNPPNGVFGPVWTLLYAMMAIAAWLIWRRSQDRAVGAPLTLFAIQLVLNVLWSAVFFHLHRVGAAFADVVLLWSLILATTMAFRRISGLAAGLMAPYLAWVTFASYLNFTIWRLNS